MLKLVSPIGIAFVVPVFIVLLNFVGDHQRGGHHQVVAGRDPRDRRCSRPSPTPSADIISMFMLAIPMVVLYFAAWFIAHLHDRRVAAQPPGVRSRCLAGGGDEPLTGRTIRERSRPAHGKPRLRRVPRRGSASTSTRSSARPARALEEGSSVLVAAPTGAGKTIVGRVRRAISRCGSRARRSSTRRPSRRCQQPEVPGAGRRVRRRRGRPAHRRHQRSTRARRIVVMTTEVLRNMLYADSPTARPGWRTW